MRNLKKFLALVLAMMMAFSLMVTANAAKDANATVDTNKYSDADTVDETFVEAVDVLYGMGIMTGDYGKVKGDQKIMRSEMAAVLYRLMTGDVGTLKSPLYASIAAERFKDVKESDWFAPYIGWCVSSGIMVGSNGYVRPWDNVTGYETVIMVLRAMGYGKNGEYTGKLWSVNGNADATQVGLLKDVNSSHYAYTLSQFTRRDVVASIVFQGAQLPTVTYSPSLGYNQYVGVAVGTGGNVLNPSLGMTNFGLTCHKGIVVGNQASGETGAYATKIGFNVVPNISKGINIGQDVAGLATGATAIVSGTLISAEISDAATGAAYYYASDMNDAKNVTLAFNWKTDLSQFNHKVKVWYDCRGTATTSVGLTKRGSAPAESAAYNNSSVTFGTNCKTYALYDEGNGWVNTAAVFDVDTTANNNDLSEVFGAGVGTFFNYAFAPMSVSNQLAATGAANYTTVASLETAASPIKSNNSVTGKAGTPTVWPLYLAVDNTGDGNAEVIISLNVTVSKVTQENTTQAPFTTGILTANGNSTADYFDLWDQQAAGIGFGAAATPDPTQDYSNIANGNIVDQEGDKPVLRDYAAAVTVTGTTKNNTGAADASAPTAPTAANAAATPPTRSNAGSANAATGMNSTFYYKVTKLTEKQVKTVWKYDINTHEVFFSDGTSYERSIFAPAVDGSFKAAKYVQAPIVYGTYTFWLDEEGKYMFWEEGTPTAEFVYGTYIDWQTQVLSGKFSYPMLYVNAAGKDQQRMENVASITNAAGTTNAIDINTYGDKTINLLPKRNDAQGTTGSDSGFYPGAYVGYAKNGDALTVIQDNTVAGGDLNTGFWQGGTNNFGTATRTTLINATSVGIGAVAVANNSGTTTDNTGLDGTVNADRLFLTNTTKFVVVDGAGTESQTSTIYTGIKEFLGDSATVMINATTGLSSSDAAPYLDNSLAPVGTNPYLMVYYSLADETYDQIYDPSAKVVDTVFVPAQLISRTSKAPTGDLHFVGDNTYNIINEDDNATLFTMYVNGVEGLYWIRGLANGSDATGTNDAFVIASAGFGKNVWYQLVDTGSTAHDGQPIYRLLSISSTDANAGLIGKYYGEMGGTTSRTTAAQTTVNAALAGQGYVATTRNSQVALIGGRNGNDLYNVASANVKNLHSAYTINSLQDLNGQSSLTNNTGVYVSCQLGDTGVAFIYVNAD